LKKYPTPFSYLPQSIGDLKNLEELHLYKCRSLDKRARRIISLLRQKGVTVDT
jgi:hypothetical protein